MKFAFPLHLVILTFIVIVDVCELLVVTEKFGCSSQEHTFENIGPLSEMACKVSLLWRRGLFYYHKDGICHIDAGGSDDYEGNFVGRFFETIDTNQIAVGKPTSASLHHGGVRDPSVAVDDDLGSFFHSDDYALEHWWFVDLMRPYNISSVKVFYRGTFLERNFNIKIYVSSFLDYSDLFSTLPLFARQDARPSTTAVTYAPMSGQASMCGRYVVITKKVSSGVELGMRHLQFCEVRPMIQPEMPYNLLQIIYEPLKSRATRPSRKSYLWES